MRRRAEQVDQTRQRIIEAAVELHGTVGPAATTIAGIARRAGVTRLTVYRHFPDDESIFAACSAHWLSGKVPPNPAAWAATADPVERLHAGLADLYRFYREEEAMLSRVHRDRAALPDGRRKALDEQDRGMLAVLLAPFPEDRRGRLLRAVLAHACSFWTWHSLCVEHGLADREAVDLLAAAAAAIPGAAGPAAGSGPACRR